MDLMRDTCTLLCVLIKHALSVGLKRWCGLALQLICRVLWFQDDFIRTWATNDFLVGWLWSAMQIWRGCLLRTWLVREIVRLWLVDGSSSRSMGSGNARGDKMIDNGGEKTLLYLSPILVVSLDPKWGKSSITPCLYTPDMIWTSIDKKKCSHL